MFNTGTPKYIGVSAVKAELEVRNMLFDGSAHHTVHYEGKEEKVLINILYSKDYLHDFFSSFSCHGWFCISFLQYLYLSSSVHVETIGSRQNLLLIDHDQAAWKHISNHRYCSCSSITSSKSESSQLLFGTDLHSLWRSVLVLPWATTVVMNRGFLSLTMFAIANIVLVCS